MALVRTDLSEECITSIIRVRRIGALGTMLTVTSRRNTAVATRCADHATPSKVELGTNFANKKGPLGRSVQPACGLKSTEVDFSFVLKNTDNSTHSEYKNPGVHWLF
jgi:hypothetical protein